ncbi:hypothetical protein BT93_L0869 [Corymbia citriodora subsp. variegata]|uniref:Phosphatidate cytidylyltransferase n=1 Tax=Corymbia citriodora subsp. variegata TaxID=360336 RepID=A0A8T0CP92_CORYI|nr:hypothetical protein BT93_L0869 [Corymbia citriodora subsp. variegata]
MWSSVQRNHIIPPNIQKLKRVGLSLDTWFCLFSGFADIIGRRLGQHKIPYNHNKSVVGSIAMGCAGFLASLGFMSYFSSFGYVRGSWEMASGFLVVSLASALVESHPLSSWLDDNLIVPLTCGLVGSIVF